MLPLHLFELISIPVLLFVIFVLAESLLPRLPSRLPRIWLLTLIYALLLVIALHLSLKIDASTLIDTRNGVVTVATLHLGPLGGFLVALAGILARLQMGGAGAMAGTLGMAGAWAMTLVARALYRRIAPGKAPAASPLALLLAGLGGGLVTLISLSWSSKLRGHPIEPTLLILSASIQVLTTLLLGGLIRLTTTRNSALLATREANASLRHALRQTIDALSSAVLHRDPSSAQHQKRVAHLALAIGRKLGLSQKQLEGLELAALVHDVGQIEIPGEILARPGPITPIEYDLIKLHAVIGYEILQKVDLPWPLAEIVYQHHENLDGTGYPQGLTAEQICLEARILRVCDVVESMASHRVFRPAFGIEQALAEIEQMAGRELDSQVVHTCLTLFRQEGYTLLQT